MVTETQLRKDLQDLTVRAKAIQSRHHRRKLRMLAKQVEAAITIIRFDIAEDYIKKDLSRQEQTISKINNNFYQWKENNPQENKGTGNLRNRYNKLMGIKQLIWKVEVIHIILYGIKEPETSHS